MPFNNNKVDTILSSFYKYIAFINLADNTLI